jgi:HK97 family phage prohead protease
VLANIEHEEAPSATAGFGVLLREEADGFHGSFRLLETPAGETARQLIEAKALNAVSLEAKEVKTIRTRDGVLQRAKANLLAIAFTRFGAYKGAQILALREEAESIIDEELLPVEMNPDVVERLRRQGFVVPSRYTAHPADGHPGEAGTPADDTRLRESSEPTEEQSP